MRSWNSSVVILLREDRVGVSWALYLLGRHPKIQEKLYKEVEQFCGNITEGGESGVEFGFVSVGFQS